MALTFESSDFLLVEIDKTLKQSRKRNWKFDLANWESELLNLLLIWDNTKKRSLSYSLFYNGQWGAQMVHSFLMMVSWVSFEGSKSEAHELKYSARGSLTVELRHRIDVYKTIKMRFTVSWALFHACVMLLYNHDLSWKWISRYMRIETHFLWI